MLKRNNLLALIAITCVICSIDTGRSAKIEPEAESFSITLVPKTDSPKCLDDYDKIKIGRINGEITSAYNEDTKQDVDVDKIKELIK